MIIKTRRTTLHSPNLPRALRLRHPEPAGRALLRLAAAAALTEAAARAQHITAAAAGERALAGIQAGCVEAAAPGLRAQAAAVEQAHPEIAVTSAPITTRPARARQAAAAVVQAPPMIAVVSTPIGTRALVTQQAAAVVQAPPMRAVANAPTGIRALPIQQAPAAEATRLATRVTRTLRDPAARLLLAETLTPDTIAADARERLTRQARAQVETQRARHQLARQQPAAKEISTKAGTRAETREQAPAVRETGSRPQTHVPVLLEPPMASRRYIAVTMAPKRASAATAPFAKCTPVG